MLVVQLHDLEGGYPLSTYHTMLAVLLSVGQSKDSIGSILRDKILYRLCIKRRRWVGLRGSGSKGVIYSVFLWGLWQEGVPHWTVIAFHMPSQQLPGRKPFSTVGALWKPPNESCCCW